MRFYLTLAASVIILSLSACGFKPKGQMHKSASTSAIYFVSPDPYSPFDEEIKNYFQAHNFAVVLERDDSLPSLEISKPQLTQVNLASNSKGQVTRIELALNFEYKLTKNDHTLVKTMRVFNQYTVDPNSMLSNNNQRQIQEQELYSKAAHMLLRQLNYKL